MGNVGVANATCGEYHNEDKYNCPNTLRDKDYQISSQKFRQITK